MTFSDFNRPKNAPEDNGGINPATGLPHSLSLGEVFDRIRLAPAEIATLLQGWAAQHRGGAQDTLARKLAEQGASFVDVEAQNTQMQGRTSAEARASDVAVGDDASVFQRVPAAPPNISASDAEHSSVPDTSHTPPANPWAPFANEAEANAWQERRKNEDAANRLAI